jgi:ATP-dependent Clp protease adaptor protein ClpS
MNHTVLSDTQTINPPAIKPEEKVKLPAMYVVLVHNDPFTPREFVVEVLQLVFQKNADEASHIMTKAHRTGVGAVGVFTFEVAETKTAKANKYSLDQGKLLLFSVEEA